jgi:hypothetical protein
MSVVEGYGDAADADNEFGGPEVVAADPGPTEIPGYPGWTVGDFRTGNGLLGMSPPQDAAFQLAAMRTRPKPGSAGDLGPVQAATRAVNGVPLAIYQPQPSQTGAAGVGDVDGLIRSLSHLSPPVLERFSNANIPFISVRDSTDQAFPNAGLLQKRPRGYPSGEDFGDVAGGYVDFRRDPTIRKRLSSSDPVRAVVVGSPALTSSYDVGLHETGHGWDNLNAVNGRAASLLAPFQSAYDAEAPNLLAQAEAKAANDPANNDAYYYYLQGGDAGASEAYAESFAKYMAGDPSLKTDWPSLYAYWEVQDRAHGLRSTPAQNGR